MKIVSEKKPIVAILGGTGKEGPGLATRWALAGYRIIIGSRKLEKAQTTAQEINKRLNFGNVTGETNPIAAQKCDIAVLTVIQSAHDEALESLKEYLRGKILVDATARVDFRNPVPPEPPSAARIAQNILGEDVYVVAAFQNVPAHALKKNLNRHLDADVLVCGEEKVAIDAVIRLAKDGGMNAFYAGGLDNALVVEGLTALLISMNKYYKIKTASIHITGIEK